MVSLPLTGYVLKAAVRDKMMVSFLVLVLVGISMGAFFGSAAATEADVFAMVFTAGSLRIAGVLGLILFIVFHMRRSFDTKDVDFLLTCPISRSTFLLSHSLAFTVIASVLALLITGSLLALNPHVWGAGFLLWAFSLFIEFIIMANVALFFSMVLPSAVSGAMSVLALYLLARLMGEFLGIIDRGINLFGFDEVSIMMQMISLIAPRLDLFAQTSWLIYAPDAVAGYLFTLAQGVSYTFLLLAAALIDLDRRQF